VCESPNKGLEAGAWEGWGMELDPGLAGLGVSCPFPPKNLFDFRPFENKQLDPAPGGILLQGRPWHWAGCVLWHDGLPLNFPFPPHFAWWVPKVPVQELLCSVGALAPAPQTGISELSDPCHESPARRL